MSSERLHYLAGPMTGIAQFNFPAFDDAANRLRECGINVISPAEMDDPETRAAALASVDGRLLNGASGGHTWGSFLARDVRIVADRVHGIIFLPGWEKSRGARLEAYVGILCKHEFRLYLGNGRTEQVSPLYIFNQLIKETEIGYSRGESIQPQSPRHHQGG